MTMRLARYFPRMAFSSWGVFLSSALLAAQVAQASIDLDLGDPSKSEGLADPSIVGLRGRS